MDKFLKYACPAILFLLLSGGCLSAQTVDPATVPGMEGFNISGGVEEFAGDDLFLLINGGAELYHEYGFEKVTVFDYRDETGKALHVEVYEFHDASGAWGIYSASKNSDCHTVDLRLFACMSSNYLMLQNGKYFTMIQAYDFIDEAEARYVMLNFADKLDENISFDNQRVTELLGMVPEGLDQGKIRYFKGNIGLSNIYPFHYHDIFSMQEGMAYTGSDEMIFMIRSKETDLDSLRVFFDNNKKFRDVVVDKETLTCRDNKDRHLLLRQSGPWIAIQIGEEDKPGQRMQAWTQHVLAKTR